MIESTALTVTAQSSPDMTVKVSGSTNADNVVFLTANGDFYGGWNTAPYNVIIPSNSSGVTKYDNVIAYADTAAGSSTANNPGGLKFLAVRGNINPYTFPTDAEINAIISNKPFLRLKDVTINSGVNSINSGNLTNAPVIAGIPSSRIAANAVTNAWTFRANTGATPPTTTSNGWTSMNAGTLNLSGSITTTGGNLLVTMSFGGFYIASGNGHVGISLSGTATEICGTLPNSAAAQTMIGTQVVTGVAAGTYTVTPMWYSAATGSMTVTAYVDVLITIVEMKR